MDRGSAPPLAFGPDPATVRLDQVFDDREPEAGPAFVAGAGLIRPVETLEDPGQVLARNPGSRVAHAQAHAGALWPPVKGDAPAARGITERVIEEVGEHLPHRVRIGLHQQRIGGDIERKVDASAGGSVRQAGPGLPS